MDYSKGIYGCKEDFSFPQAKINRNRIPTGTRITAEQLEKVEQAESALMDMGFSDFRVRHPEGYAKLQVKPEQLSLVFEKREEILAVLEPLFGTVCLDMKTR